MTSQLPLLVGYLCAVRAEGRVQGTGREAAYIFDAFQTISPVLALRWLRHQALYLAHRVGPDPAALHWAPPGAFRTCVSNCDPAGELRAWAAYFVPHREAQRHLREGNPLTAVVDDVDAQCRFLLSALPIHAPVSSLHPEPPPWSQESYRRRYGSSPSDQGGPKHRRRRRAPSYA
ncbi:hypothetical protein [Streptomyces acidiscabies]|uniref:hypothetical protein n=1 Tax=Streptomyces acidiscabies TaxID=42234 RepID=UPI000A8405E3|nr:hypothetical protein [Streptomyces acidiscabies]